MHLPVPNEATRNHNVLQVRNQTGGNHKGLQRVTCKIVRDLCIKGMNEHSQVKWHQWTASMLTTMAGLAECPLGLVQFFEFSSIWSTDVRELVCECANLASDYEE